MSVIPQVGASGASLMSAINLQSAQHVGTLLIKGPFLVVAPIATLILGSAINQVFERHLYIDPSEPTKILPEWSWTVFRYMGILDNLVFTIYDEVVTRCLPFATRSERYWLYADTIGPIWEEFEWRWFVQHICLTVVPEIILNTLRPGYGSVVYSLAARVARVVLNAGLFALVHTEYWGAGRRRWAGVNTQFIGGLLFSGVTEVTGSIFYSSVMHSIHNFSVDYVNWRRRYV